MSVENTYGTVEMSYNSRNFITMRIDGEGNESRWFYDRMGNLTDYYPAKQWKEQGGGNILSVSVYGAGPEEETQKENLKITYQYDLKDRIMHRTNPGGAVTRYLYDQNDRLLKEISPYGYNRESDSGAGTSCRYDSRGNLIRVTKGLDQVVEERSHNLQDMPFLRRDGLGNETAYQYTLDGQISRTVNAIRYPYNSFGEVRERIDIERRDIWWSYKF